MNRKILIAGSILIFVLFLGYFGIKFWINHNLESIINKNEERAYDIRFETIDLDPLLRGLHLENVSIQPVDTAASNNIEIEGAVKRCAMRGIHMLDLIFNRAARISDLEFIEPVFSLSLVDTVKTPRQSKKGIQHLFSDILSRGEISNFLIKKGQISFEDQIHQTGISSIEKIDLLVTGLKTDSIQLQHIIPFQFDKIDFDLSEITYSPDSLNTLNIGSIKLNSAKEEMHIRDISWKLNKPWKEVSQIKQLQIDLIQAYVKELSILKVKEGSHLGEDIEIFAQAMEIDSVIFTDIRDHHMPRPPDVDKPMFLSMINHIPIKLSIDTIRITNGTINYGERPPKKSDHWQFTFDKVYGTMYGLSTDSIRQKSIGQFESDIEARINGYGKMTSKLIVPYDRDYFEMNANFSNYEMKNLNSTLFDMANLEIESGVIREFNYLIKAGPAQAHNEITMLYDDLKVKVEGSEHQNHRMVSLLANSLVNSHNLPDDHHPDSISYSSTRNPYRSPFNYIWFSLEEGIMQIVPSKTAQRIIEKKKKKG